ncbi:MAG: hypothetical protein CMO29_19320 [Tistrella sp.]|nr:hypothetical protein [Tistrella sp.]
MLETENDLLERRRAFALCRHAQPADACRQSCRRPVRLVRREHSRRPVEGQGSRASRKMRAQPGRPAFPPFPGEMRRRNHD